jgi:hypothetical protein
MPFLNEEVLQWYNALPLMKVDNLIRENEKSPT